MAIAGLVAHLFPAKAISLEAQLVLKCQALPAQHPQDVKPSCISEERAVGFVQGSLTGSTVGTVERHLEECPDCRRLLVEIAKASATFATAPEPGEPRPPLSLEVGSTVGRFIVTEVLGAGAMGVVYCAYDPKLHRRVALKFLKGNPGEEAQARLLLEAQALARLTHPNVVGIHDVGVYDAGTHGAEPREEVYLAMEFCEGGTLQEWLARESRSADAILARFEEAGRGLLAAHAGQLVHRDYKPANVLLNGDEVAKVTDFGLAFLGESHDASGVEEDVAVTRTGALMGTPAYMSPEQLRGQRASSQSDQFSFAVALWEGLTGGRPFAGDSAKAILENIESQNFSQIDALPARLRPILSRALRADPSDRYPTLEPLLEALRPKPKRKLHIALGVSLLLALAVLAFFLRPGRAPATCDGAARHLEPSWNAQSRAAMGAAFASSRIPGSEALWSQAEARMQSYADAWSQAHTASCEATSVYREQSSEVMDLRMDCLRRHREEFDALATLFTQATPEVVARSLDLLDRLPKSERCSDISHVRSRGALPTNGAVRRQVLEFQETLARARTLEHAGDFKGAFALVEPLAKGLQPAEHRATRAELSLAAGRLAAVLGQHSASEEFLRTATLDAEASNYASLRGIVAVELGRTIGFKMGRYDEGLRILQEAHAILEGQGGPAEEAIQAKLLEAHIHYARGEYDASEALHTEIAELLKSASQSPAQSPSRIGVALRAEVSNARGKLALVRGAYPEAKGHFQAALETLRTSLGEQHPLVAAAYLNLGSVAKDLGDGDEALDLYGRALKLYKSSLGESHVDVGRVLGNIGLAQSEYGSLDEALTNHLESLSILERELGDAHPSVGLQLNNVALTHIYMRNAERALPYLDRASTLFSELSPEHERLAIVDSNRGLAYRALGNFAEAKEAYKRASERFEAAHGPKHLEVGRIHAQLGVIAIIEERYEDSIPMLKDAIAVLSAASPRGETLAKSHLDLGWVYEELGREDEAIAKYETAIEHYDALERPNLRRQAAARTQLAELLWRRGKRKDARERMAEAEKLFAAGGEAFAEAKAQAADWLRNHR